ncbi:MAG: cupredoxin domain-containing protein [Chloroflexi bacterium]|nr:cupredoxin domain-containing protein [Chloroflexota bacterium]
MFVLALAAACQNNGDIGATGLQPDGSYIIVGTEFAFEPETIQIPVNEEAVIEFRNLGTVDHDLVIEEFDVATGSMRIGSKKTVRFTPTVLGEFELICSIPGHPDAGMTGTVVVVESPIQAVAQG